MVPIDMNMDILLSILSRSPPKTATSMMATCHFLYHEGAKYILQQPISLAGSEREVLSLLCFIQAEDLSRCPYVRDLSIPISITSEYIAKALSVVVPRMSNIAVLHLNGEHPLGMFPYLLPIFASIRSLKTLTLSEAGNRSCELLRTLQSQLVVANILFSLAFIAPIHPLHLLWRSASTLREMKCSFRSEAQASIEAAMSSPIIYPNVRNLVLDNRGDVPFISPYIQALPNLVHLRMERNYSLLEDFPELGIVPPSHRMNMTLRGGTGQPLAWKHIQTYSGILPVLRTLYIPFPIPRLYLTRMKFTTISASRAPLRLTEVLASARPVHLSIGFEDRPFSVCVCPGFLEALGSEGASHLQSLTVTIELMAADVDSSFDVGVFWTTIEDIFSHLPLRDLDMVMRDISLCPSASDTEGAALPSFDRLGMDSQRAHAYNHYMSQFGIIGTLGPYEHSTPSQDGHRTSFTLVERTLEDFDVCAFVGRLAASIPTLRNAVVSVSRPRRWVSGMRTARLEKKNEDSEMLENAGNNVLYEEAPDTVQGNENKGWASLSRASYYGWRG